MDSGLYHACPLAKVESRGKSAGDSAAFWLAGKRVPYRASRGLNFLVVDVRTTPPKPIDRARFDWNDAKKFLEWTRGLPKGVMVMCAAKDYANLHDASRDTNSVEALRTLGVLISSITAVHQRYGGFALITYVPRFVLHSRLYTHWRL